MEIYFISPKTLFWFLRYLVFLNFKEKLQMEWLWRHKMASISYQSKYLTLKLNSKTPWIKASQVARCWISKERKFLNILATWKGTGNNFQVPFVFLIIYIKRLGLKTTKFDFLRILILLFQNNLFPKEFLEYIGYIFSYLLKWNRDFKLVLGQIFFSWKLLIWYSIIWQNFSFRYLLLKI